MVEFVRPKTPGNPLRIKITLPSNAYFMSGLRDFTLSFIKNVTDFSEQWAYRFQAIVDELCNNAIEYGSASGADIDLTLIYTPHEGFEVTVEDTGTGKSHMSAAELQSLVSAHKKPGFVSTEIRGRGLAKIVAEWSDELEFSDRASGGIRVRVKKLLPETVETRTKTPNVPSVPTLVLQ